MSEDSNTTDIKWIKETLKGQDKKLDEIKDQAVLTNGRVKALELWKAGVVGKVAGISAAVAAIMTVVFALIK